MCWYTVTVKCNLYNTVFNQFSGVSIKLEKKLPIIKQLKNILCDDLFKIFKSKNFHSMLKTLTHRR